MRGVWLVLVVVLASGCSFRASLVPKFREEPERRTRPNQCADGLPVKVLTDPKCEDGICGYSCDPDRWTVNSGARGRHG